MIYGAIFDAHCTYWQTMQSSSQTCDSNTKDDAIKHCAVFDIKGLALWYHIVTCFLLTLSLPANLYAWWKCRKVDEKKNIAKNKEEEEPST